jgi:S1-C subfamily serine protease
VISKKLAYSCVAFLLATALQADEKKPWLGLGLVLKSSPSGEKFLYVAHAPADAPAHRAGVRPGDLITTIEGKRITFHDDLEIAEFTSTLPVGKVLRMRLIRAGKQLDVRVRIGELPAEYVPMVQENLRRAREARARAKQ